MPSVEASAAILVDLDAGQVLFAEGVRSGTAGGQPDEAHDGVARLGEGAGRLDRTVRVHPDAVFGRNDYGVGSTLGLRSGERVSVRDLLAGLLLGSANDAAEALAIEDRAACPPSCDA